MDSLIALCRHREPFVFGCDFGGVSFAHLLAWEGVVRRPTALGLTGRVRRLRTAPAEGSWPAEFRIHVCAEVPCPCEKWPVSKYGSSEPPMAHGRMVALISGDLSMEELAKHVPAVAGPSAVIEAPAVGGPPRLRSHTRGCGADGTLEIWRTSL